MLIISGLVLLGVGLLISFGEHLPFRIGRLPGDIVIKGKRSTFYFPLMTCVLLSLLGSLVVWIVGRR